MMYWHKFKDELPNEGQTILVITYQDAYLRNMPEDSGPYLSMTDKFPHCKIFKLDEYNNEGDKPVTSYFDSSKNDIVDIYMYSYMWCEVPEWPKDIYDDDILNL